MLLRVQLTQLPLVLAARQVVVRLMDKTEIILFLVLSLPMAAVVAVDMEMAGLLQAQVVVLQMGPLLVAQELLVKEMLEVLVVLRGVMGSHRVLVVGVVQVQ
jgi:hypothetical protein